MQYTNVALKKYLAMKSLSRWTHYNIKLNSTTLVS